MASHGLPQANLYHYKAFRLTINRVGKYPTSWKLKKLSKTGVHALSSPCRTTSLLVLKESNGRISHNSREKEDTLSLNEEQNLLHLFSFLPLHVFPFAFVLFFLLIFFPFFSFLFSFSLHFSSFFPFSFGPFSPPFWRNHHPVNGRKFPPLLPQAKCVALLFPPFSFIS